MCRHRVRGAEALQPALRKHKAEQAEKQDNSVLYEKIWDLGTFADPAGGFLQGCKSQGKKQRLLAGICIVRAVVIWPGQN